MSRNQDKKEKKIETNCFVQCLCLDTNARVEIGKKREKDGISLFFSSELFIFKRINRN